MPTSPKRSGAHSSGTAVAPAVAELVPAGHRVEIVPLDPVLRLVARTPVYVPLDAPLRTVAATMADESIGVVLVRGPYGPAGIVSERDIVLALAEDGDPDQERARDVMTPDLASIGSGETILMAAHVMLANEIRHLVVTSGSATVGLVSMRDVLAVLADHAGRP
jgi:signal-transduction protein with cAMP-binding, CBS, and nucleotidyltransferase domain